MKSLFVFLIISIIFIVPLTVYAQTSMTESQTKPNLDEISIGVKSEDLHETEKENIKLKSQIQDLEEENAELKSEISSLLNKISELEEKITNLNQIIQEQINVILKHFTK